LKKKARVQFEDDSVTVAHKMTLLLRLQQVLSGFLPSDNEDAMIHLFAKPEDNPRVKALLTMLESLEEEEEQAIIWCRFVPEILLLEKVLGDKCFTMYGATKNRESIKDRFMAGERPYIVANVAVGGTGLDYSGLYTMIYYSNDFNFINRDQSEARPLHVGQTRSLLVVDIEAEDTVDQQIVSAMNNKLDVDVQMIKL
jgi:SNF2 family DNA or RNA helicase